MIRNVPAFIDGPGVYLFLSDAYGRFHQLQKKLPSTEFIVKESQKPRPGVNDVHSASLSTRGYDSLLTCIPLLSTRGYDSLLTCIPSIPDCANSV